MSTILQIAQSIATRWGLPKPASLFTNSDQTANQILELIREEVSSLSRRYQWQALINRVELTTVATESQGAITTLFPAHDYIINDTVWNVTTSLPIFGAMTPKSYNSQKAIITATPYPQYTIRNGLFLIYPAPNAGETIAVDYMTKYVGKDNSNALITDFTADTDMPLLDNEAVTLGALWRFKAQKGFDYAEDFNKYERVVKELMTRDAPKEVGDLGGGLNDSIGGVIIPLGSWSV